jgi:hypothetical protein
MTIDKRSNRLRSKKPMKLLDSKTAVTITILARPDSSPNFLRMKTARHVSHHLS